MPAVEIKQFAEPDETWEFGDKGRSEIIRLGGIMVVRSVLEPGWSWLEQIKPTAGGLEDCPLRHREYVIAGRVRYETRDGDSFEAGAGSYLQVDPGHLASVVGDETCVLLDFDEDWGE